MIFLKTVEIGAKNIGTSFCSCYVNLFNCSAEEWGRLIFLLLREPLRSLLWTLHPSSINAPWNRGNAKIPCLDFFLSRFSFTDTDDSWDKSRWDGNIFITLYHFHRSRKFRHLHLGMWDCHQVFFKSHRIASN